MRGKYIIVCALLALGACADDAGQDPVVDPGNNGVEPDPCDGDCAPEVSLSGPEWVDLEATLLAEASDDLGVTSVAFFDGESSIGTVAGSPFTLLWDTSGVSEGVHSVSARATDTGGQATEASIEVGVDHTDPRVTLAFPDDGTIAGTAVPIEATVDDISPTTFGCGFLGTSIATYLEPEGLVYSGELRTFDLERGEHTLLCTAMDAVGRSKQISRQVVVDRKPVVAFVSPRPGTVVRARTQVFLAAEDDGEVTRLELYANDLLVGEAVDGGVWWSPEASGSVTLEGRAWDDREQMGRARIEVEVEIDPCDLDGDGVQGGEGDCGGLDCDDGDAEVFPGAPDDVGDEVDQSCDGVDGTDADTDGFASAESGGRDCDDGDAEIYPCAWDPEGICADRATDPRNCGTCLNICSVGLTCEAGDCTCVADDCVEGTPEDYEIADIPSSFFYRIQVQTDGERGEDVDDDGEIDNAFGPLVQTLAQLLGGNINRELTFQIDNGILALGAKWPNLDGVGDQEDVQLDIFTLVDTDDDPMTQDAYLISRESFLPGYQTPRSRFSGGTITDGRLVAGPSPAFFLEVPLGGIPLAVVIEDAVLRATIRLDDNGVVLSNATIAGVLPLQSLIDTVNDYLLSDTCECIHLESPLVDLRAGEGRETCVGDPMPNRCAEEGGDAAVCATISSSCRLFMDLMFNEVDIDTDGDGENDAFSIYLALSARGTSIGGLAAE